MKLRHAAALVGWFLISAPSVPSKGPYLPSRYDYAAPLSKWHRSTEQFAYQEQCEIYKCKRLEGWHSNLMPDPRRGIEVEAVERSFCIEENDPRLKPK